MNKIFSLNILGKVVAIDYVPSNSRADATMGRNDVKLNRMTINEDMPQENKEEVILHETIHFIDDNLSLSLTEQQVTALSSVLYSVLKTNNFIDHG